MNMVSASPVALGAPLAMRGAPGPMAQRPRWAPTPHRWKAQPRRMGQARLGQYGPLGIDFPLIGLIVDVGAMGISYLYIKKEKPKGWLMFGAYAILVLSGLRGIYDGARLVDLLLGSGK